jgi:hypothetical protein
MESNPMRHIAALALLTVASCAPAPDFEGDRAELLRLHEQARIAHLQKRADLMGFTDSLMVVARGGVTVRSAAENAARFQAYVDRSTFQEWDDVAPPLIRISPDGGMAYVVVRKSVRLTAPDSIGALRPEHRVFAWVEVYEKRSGRWTRTLVASTDRPGPV